jgi:hypothetical protein
MATIQEFRDAWADKPNRDKAIAIAEEYITENAAVLDPLFGDKTSPELVTLIDAARLAGNEDVVTALTMYELVHFERQEIGGAVRARPKFEGPARRLRAVKE